MKRTKEFLLKNVGGQDLLVPLGTKVREMNCLITLNATGRYIWELLAEDRSIEDLTAEIAEKFHVDSEQAQYDVRVFLNEIQQLGLLET